MFVFPPGVVFVFPPGVVPLSSTLIVAVPLTPFDDVAVITTVPSFTPVTFPVLSTVAIVSLALDHVIFVSVIGDVVAVNWSVSPAFTVPFFGVISTAVTTSCFSIIVTSHVLVNILLLNDCFVFAVIVAFPAFIPLIVPSSFTVATFSLLLDHTITLLSIILLSDVIAATFQYSPFFISIIPGATFKLSPVVTPPFCAISKPAIFDSNNTS